MELLQRDAEPNPGQSGREDIPARHADERKKEEFVNHCGSSNEKYIRYYSYIHENQYEKQDDPKTSIRNPVV